VNLIVCPSGTAEWNKARIRCALGFGGISYQKREGDGVTPAGHFLLRRVFYRADRMEKPRTILPLSPLCKKNGWCDSPSDASYNKFVSLPFSGHHEKLWRNDAIYDLIVVVGYNDRPIIPNAGSAIFIHVATPGFEATKGCVAFTLSDLLKILENWHPESALEIRTSGLDAPPNCPL
jgi:L,D-peptidoglycan transpeptidase YkuD (ErfK/YbiS/YcfS/YnhG family)